MKTKSCRAHPCQTVGPSSKTFGHILRARKGNAKTGGHHVSGSLEHTLRPCGDCYRASIHVADKRGMGRMKGNSSRMLVTAVRPGGGGQSQASCQKCQPCWFLMRGQGFASFFPEVARRWRIARGAQQALGAMVWGSACLSRKEHACVPLRVMSLVAPVV